MNLEQTKQYKFSESEGNVLFNGNPITSSDGEASGSSGIKVNLSDGDITTVGEYTLSDDISNYDTIEIITKKYEKIPPMTSNSTPTPYVISASSFYTNTATGASYDPYKAFNGNITEYWYTSGEITPWLGIYNPNNKALKRFIIYTFNTNSGAIHYPPKTISVQGSNDNINFTEIQNLTTSWSNSGTVSDNLYFDFSLNSNTPYLYYRFYLRNASSTPQMEVFNMDIYFNNINTYEINVNKYPINCFPVRNDIEGTLSISNGKLIVSSYLNPIQIIGIKHNATIL